LTQLTQFSDATAAEREIRLNRELTALTISSITIINIEVTWTCEIIYFLNNCSRLYLPGAYEMLSTSCLGQGIPKRALTKIQFQLTTTETGLSLN